MSYGYLSMSEPGAYLEHHGIKGQEWGVMHGPPYPLDSAESSRIKFGHVLNGATKLTKSVRGVNSYVSLAAIVAQLVGTSTGMVPLTVAATAVKAVTSEVWTATLIASFGTTTMNTVYRSMQSNPKKDSEDKKK